MTTTVVLTPTQMYPTRRATLIRTDRGGLLEGAIEINECHKAPNGSLVSRFTVHEQKQAVVTPGDRVFRLKRPNCTNTDFVCLPADPREFPMCNCAKWVENAWCLHVDVMRALQAENLLEKS